MLWVKSDKSDWFWSQSIVLTDCMRPSKNHILTNNFSQDIQIIQGVSQLLR